MSAELRFPVLRNLVSRFKSEAAEDSIVGELEFALGELVRQAELRGLPEEAIQEQIEQCYAEVEAADSAAEVLQWIYTTFAGSSQQQLLEEQASQDAEEGEAETAAGENAGSEEGEEGRMEHFDSFGAYPPFPPFLGMGMPPAWAWPPMPGGQAGFLPSPWYPMPMPPFPPADFLGLPPQQHAWPALAPAQDRKIFVGGIPQEFNHDDLRDTFAVYGPIKKSWLQKFRAGQDNAQAYNHRGFGFVVFQDKAAVDQLLGEEFSIVLPLQGRFSSEKPIEVKRALSSQKILHGGSAGFPPGEDDYTEGSNGNWPAAVAPDSAEVEVVEDLDKEAAGPKEKDSTQLPPEDSTTEGEELHTSPTASSKNGGEVELEMVSSQLQ
mmetsp:Transcript_10052/g.22585  ORF Transcript_10052/g.22585 Transcript_10052/m.22585 type:complete len:379 (-) Transcript_10052:305-1441(-)|eukprot:CAMPEP_0178378898 /NCGR_PEP_ID=MMETSP0689_2-20121128/4663_1 /TAXON_ID=160604 /ORGANISM="Amphidinium massartii, Strain CS-259" /LENGTH=378 /DNA_ID=CAMNT_0019998981 /DNA_START=89 /DNA_END=1225 /DNA_ORIENTATION=-